MGLCNRTAMTVNLNAQFLTADIGYRRSATYFRTPVTEALCSSLALKEEHTEGVREIRVMKGQKSGENCVLRACTVHQILLRWPHQGLGCTMCGANRKCIQRCARQREEKHHLEDLVIEGKTVLHSHGFLKDSLGQCGQELSSWTQDQVTGFSGHRNIMP